MSTLSAAIRCFGQVAQQVHAPSAIAEGVAQGHDLDVAPAADALLDGAEPRPPQPIRPTRMTSSPAAWTLDRRLMFAARAPPVAAVAFRKSRRDLVIPISWKVRADGRERACSLILRPAAATVYHFLKKMLPPGAQDQITCRAYEHSPNRVMHGTSPCHGHDVRLHRVGHPVIPLLADGPLALQRLRFETPHGDDVSHRPLRGR